MHCLVCNVIIVYSRVCFYDDSRKLVTQYLSVTKSISWKRNTKFQEYNRSDLIYIMSCNCVVFISQSTKEFIKSSKDQTKLSEIYWKLCFLFELARFSQLCYHWPERLASFDRVNWIIQYFVPNAGKNLYDSWALRWLNQNHIIIEKLTSGA